MADLNQDAKLYYAKARDFCLLTEAIMREQHSIQQQWKLTDDMLDKMGDKENVDCRDVFCNPGMNKMYGNFVQATVKCFTELFKAQEWRKICLVHWLLLYFIEVFPFDCSFVYGKYSKKYDIGMKDADEKELFCRRLLDMFPLYILPETDEKKVRMMYCRFLVMFCFEYRSVCCALYLNTMSKCVSLDVADNLECIARAERYQQILPIDYTFSLDAKDQYRKIVFRSLGTLSKSVSLWMADMKMDKE